MTHLALASLFPAGTKALWSDLVAGVLKGADLERKLVAHTQDGIPIQPLYARAEGAQPVTGPREAPWRIVQRVDHPEPARANALALEDLEGGADALSLVFAGAPAARGFGLPRGRGALEAALSGAMLDLIAIRLDAGRHGLTAAASLIDLLARRGHDLGDLDLDLGIDPVGAIACGRPLLPVDPKAAGPWEAEAAAVLADLADRGFRGRAFLVDGRPYHEAGASEAQELAATLATGVAYLRALEAGGHSLEAARDAMAFLAVADADEFLTIAKFRALRRLWGRIERACGLAPRPIRLHAETAWRMTTRRDPWVNILRGTLAAFSAGIGGADTILVLPFTAPLGLPDAFARRVARNTQLVLSEEANLWRVADPVAGAGGFEALTDELAATAWSLFQDIEREGGIARSLQGGGLQHRIAATHAARDALVATRRAPLTGTSEFPDLHETPVSVLMPAALPDASDESGPGTADGSGVEPLPSRRTAEAFEHLRDLSDHRLAATGARPRVFLANLGPLSAFSTRATFAKNAFGAGGIEAVGNDGFASHEAMAAAFEASGAQLACLCSSDEVYAREAVAAAGALKAAGAGAIYLAGRPGADRDALEAAGVTDFIGVGSNLISLLGEAQAAA